MIRKPKNAARDEVTVAGLAVGLLVLIPGAMLLALLPLMSAINRIGYVGTTLFVLAIGACAIAVFPAYEHFKPSSPPTPRRDFVVILFAALLIGLWTFAFANQIVAVVVLAALGAIVLLPDDWRQRLADHLPSR
ncbi:MAG: hypothetical protein ACXWNI_01415 [Candidatus Limnocylindrales bacterium]